MSLIKTIFLLLVCSIYAQNNNEQSTVQVSYLQTLQLYGPGSKYQTNALLTMNSFKSIYEIDHTKSLTEDNVNNKNEDIVIGLSSKENEFVYKDFYKNESYYVETVEFKFIHIIDSLNTMRWELKEEFEEIFGFKCQKAITSYGGRNYIAFFTTEMAFANGPWRFDGLPGLILNVTSDDSVFSILATSIKLVNKNVEFVNPYENEISLDWNSFLSFYRQRYDAVMRNSMESWGPSMTLPKKNIVEYIKN
ncbi:hypothetical protein ULMS_10850 [Patiriisocius marinistellae]|uniref:GLPGLI family protein n=1 Tax=Patiriisocius marinistellae TaxID=2494560 RepID=A0A5J4FT51_9FLAO|nr:GLPGLI family protein [Patiriisocius marinistellae]GEQ85577.1 hypothetical protein ULMS_10850 [Patiriisocius marinistellae]